MTVNVVHIFSGYPVVNLAVIGQIWLCISSSDICLGRIRL